MIFFNRNSRKTLTVILIFLSVSLFCNVANSSTLTDDISNIFGFINKNVIGQIKKDFCRQYILALSSGEWANGEFRTNIGKRVCTSYSVPTTSDKLVSSTVQPLNGNSAVSQIEIPTDYSVNNPKPDIFVQNQNTNGASLDVDQIINLTNQERKNNDSSFVNLKENIILKKIAAIRVKDMFANQYFEHNSPTGDNASKEATKNDYTYITIGENIALGNFDGSSGLVTAWMNSPGHRANILNKNYTEIGVYAEQGIYNGQKVWIAAQIFGKPITGCAEPDKNIENNVNKYKISASSMLNNIKNIDEELKNINIADTQVYNSKVAERNNLATLYNNLAAEIKTLVAEYNKEVATFNDCIKTI